MSQDSSDHKTTLFNVSLFHHKTDHKTTYTVQYFITCGRVKSQHSGHKTTYTIQYFITSGRVKSQDSDQNNYTTLSNVICGRVKSQNSDQRTTLHYPMFHYLWEEEGHKTTTKKLH